MYDTVKFVKYKPGSKAIFPLLSPEKVFLQFHMFHLHYTAVLLSDFPYATAGIFIAFLWYLKTL